MTLRVGRWQRFRGWVAPPAPEVATQLRSAITTRRAYLQIAAVYLLGFGLSVVSAFVLLAHPGEGISRHVPTPNGQIINEVIDWALQLPGLVLAVWLAHRRGWTLRRLGVGARWATGTTRRKQAIRIGCAMFLSQLVAGAVLSILAPGTHFPTGATGAWGMIGGVSGSIRAGLAEELVVTAFIVTTLRQARRPWPEIVLVSLALRLAYHVYYGTPWIVLWIAIWAGTAFGLYWRTRRLTPIMVGHALWDLLGFTTIELGHVGRSIVGSFYLLAFLTGFALLLTSTTKALFRGPAQTSVR